jgi:hypothetical protein
LYCGKFDPLLLCIYEAATPKATGKPGPFFAKARALYWDFAHG